jgi:hypothetical protein
MSVNVKKLEREIKMVKYILKCCIFVFLFSFGQSFYNLALANSSSCVVHNNQVMSIRIGDPVDKLYEKFQCGYKLNDKIMYSSTRVIEIAKNNKHLFNFYVDQNGQIFLIDIFYCSTRENIGPGSTLDEALKVYGEGSIEPSDIGYFLTFENLKNILFLLNNELIPKELRDIPDDIFTEEAEKKILMIRNIKISAIRIISEE